ncbi:calcium sensing receptor, chloroplastic [Senna tora]|uniref:Calcium sensing receptor, chloroplastic n=1 Tax=Senna tora TaxID=362788 RepID=A0A834X6Z0_9FABA|nr:calcium sensing receptor, chloroplastic [Senna tora]
MRGLTKRCHVDQKFHHGCCIGGHHKPMSKDLSIFKDCDHTSLIVIAQFIPPSLSSLIFPPLTHSLLHSTHILSLSLPPSLLYSLEPRDAVVAVMAMAAKLSMDVTSAASATARPLLPPPSTSTSSPTTVNVFPKPHLRRCASISLPTSTTISLLALFAPPNEAKALAISKEQIVSSLTEVEKTIDQVQDASSGFVDTAQRVLEVLGNALKPAVDAALPIVQQAGEEAVKIASPAISEASKKAQEALQSSGVNTEPVLTAAKTVADAAQQTGKVIEDAKPIASTTVETISSADPTVIAGTAGAIFLAYLLLPPVWSAISFNLRGYKGELTPAQTLDLLCSQNYVMVDIRSEKDKNKTGIPRLPSSAKNRMIAIPLEELPSKLRGLVRNVKKVEAEIAALKISYLKKINKGTNVVIIDSYSDSAKIVARTLTSLGFKNCWIVADGFSGSRGWLQSRLGTDSYSFSFAEVLSPSRVIPAVGRFGTTSGKLLPGAE